MFAGCGSPWKKPWRKIIVIQVSAIRYASRRRCSSDQVVEVEVAELDPLEVLEREHARPRVRQYTRGTATCGWPAKLLVEDIGVAGLEPVVELLPDRAGELVDDLVRVDEVERAHAVLREPRRLVHQLEVGLDLARRVRALHLDRDPGRSGAPHGAPGRSTRPRSALVELEEQLLDRWPSSSRITRSIGERDRPHVVLETAELGEDVRRHNVRARGEQLAELDERRSQLVEQLAQVPAARGRLPPRRRPSFRPNT